MRGIVEGVVRWSTQAKLSLFCSWGTWSFRSSLLIGANVLSPRSDQRAGHLSGPEHRAFLPLFQAGRRVGGPTQHQAHQ